MNVQEYLIDNMAEHQESISARVKLLSNLPDEVASLEADTISIYGSLLVLRDASHKDLGAKLATITGQSCRFKTVNSTRTAVFRNVGPFYKVDLDRPNPKCRKVRVLRPAKELVIELCGDIPEGYELLEELE